MRRDAFVYPPGSGSRGNPETMGERGLEPRSDHLTHEKGRRIVAPAGPPFVGVHDAFEHAAEHVGRDEFAGIMFADRKVKTLEQLVERIAPLAVAPDRRAVPPLQRRGLEQPAVEEWDLAQAPSDCAALRGRPIQRSETERVEKGAVKVAPAGDRPIEQVRNVSGIAVEPTLRLDEIEEQHAREYRERQGVTVHPRSWGREPLGEVVERVPEGTEEPWRDALARQHLADP